MTFEPSGFAVLRTPLLPFDELLRWTGDDRAQLRARLRDIVSLPEVREAIFVASPSLHDLIDIWLEQPESERGKQCERALVRYVARMTGRSTPFGLFAGVSTLTIGDSTDLALEPRDSYRRTTRLDAGYLVDVVGGLLERPELRETRRYSPNPSLYRCGNRRRYVRSRPGAEEDRHLLVSVRESEALASALAAAEDGITPEELRSALVAAGRDEERVGRFVDDLVERQVLVPDVDLRVTGGDAVYGLGEIVPTLERAREAIERLDREPPGVDAARYLAIAAELSALPAELKPDRLFQVDMSKPSPAATLGREVVKEILRGAELLARTGYRRTDETQLERFATRLMERTEGEPVPLLEALDPDVGVGFDEAPASAPLLDGVASSDGRASARWGPREAHLLERLLETRAAAGGELVLDARDLDQLAPAEAAPLPDAFAVMAAVAASSPAALAAGRFRVLVHTVDGPSGARLLGRFCHTDPRLLELVRAHLRSEEALDPEAVFAEIVHLPRARDVNVVARPVLRDLELVVLGGSGATPDRRLSLDDLLVAVENERVVLRSRRLGRRIVPRLTSAHNVEVRGMSVYRFLCALQTQDTGGVLGFWGPLESAPFLPRVRHGRVVLARARWRLESGALDDLAGWRREHDVPRFAGLLDFGGQQPVDLDNALAVDSLAQTVRSRGAVDLVELFPPPDELVVTSAEGSFAHELVVPFVRTAPAQARAARRLVPGAPATARFAPGSDWLYLRLYTGETVADSVLTERVQPLVAQAERWFFLRYRDPAFHLRVRLRGDPSALRAVQLPEDELVWRVEVGTYQRELARYGGSQAIEAVEDVFHADSDAVLAILPLLESGDAGEAERWRLGLAGVHQLLVDLGLEDAERLELVRAQRDRLARRLRWDRHALGRIGERFRAERVGLGELLDATPDGGHPLEPGLAILRDRSTRLAPVAERLLQLETDGLLTIPRATIASSFLHMHLNRLLRGDNTAQELVICDFLRRLYDARARWEDPARAARLET